jgi:hypothetical protein
VLLAPLLLIPDRKKPGVGPLQPTRPPGDWGRALISSGPFFIGGIKNELDT